MESNGKHIAFVFALLTSILTLISPAIAVVNLDISEGSLSTLDPTTFRLHNATGDIDGTPVQGRYWIDFQWDAENLVFVPVNLGSEPTCARQCLKIFVTSTKHVGDFKNDPLLSGTTAIQKADAFCNNDANKPDAGLYKALLVDGLSRDAVKRIDWVLQANTIYWRPDGITMIGTTTENAIFPALYSDLTNSVIDYVDSADWTKYSVWTGIWNASDFSAASGSITCNQWSIGTNSSSATVGSPVSKDEHAFTSAGSMAGCAFKFSLYCVEQP